MMRYWYPGMGGWGFGFGIAGMIINILFWVILIWAIISVVRHFSHTNHTPEEKTDPLEILKIRYAKGEITKSEYEEMKKELRKE